MMRTPDPDPDADDCLMQTPEADDCLMEAIVRTQHGGIKAVQ